MTPYVAPNAAAAANYASRLRKKIAAGKTITPEQQAFLDARGTPSRGRAAAPARAPAPVQRPPEASPPVEPSASPPPQPAPSPKLDTSAMHVIDFGQPQDSIAKPQNACPPGCQHTSHSHAQIPRCAINGEKQYPPFKDSAAKGVASVSFFVTGFLIAIFRGLDEVPDPTPVELEDGKDAVKDIVATRAPELGVYSDILGGVFAISAYGVRTMNMPKPERKP